MNTAHALLPPAVQKLALLGVQTPSPEAIFAHQMTVLHALGLLSAVEIEEVELELPQGPFLFIPPAGSRFPTPDVAVRSIGRAYGASSGHDHLKHPVEDKVVVPEGAYFVVGYDEHAVEGKVSAAEAAQAFQKRSLSGLTMMEVGYRLLYFPHALDKMQFGATGSFIGRGEGKDPHVPTYFRLAGEGRVILDSLLEDHHSTHTLFPCCKKRVICSLRH